MPCTLFSFLLFFINVKNNETLYLKFYQIILRFYKKSANNVCNFIYRWTASNEKECYDRIQYRLEGNDSIYYRQCMAHSLVIFTDFSQFTDSFKSEVKRHFNNFILVLNLKSQIKQTVPLCTISLPPNCRSTFQISFRPSAAHYRYIYLNKAKSKAN